MLTMERPAYPERSADLKRPRADCQVVGPAATNIEAQCHKASRTSNARIRQARCPIRVDLCIGGAGPDQCVFDSQDALHLFTGGVLFVHGLARGPEAHALHATAPFYLMSDGVEVPPMLVLFGLVAGKEIASVVGTLLSVPVLAATRVIAAEIFKEFRRPDA